jgi:hypothetical protein
MLNLKTRLLLLFIPLASLFGCSDSSDNSPGGTGNVALGQNAVYEVANGCYAISPNGGASFISVNIFEPDSDGGEGPVGGLGVNAATVSDASHFRLRPSDLAKYLLYDEEGYYMVSNGVVLDRKVALDADTRLVDDEVVIEDRMQSEGEWQLHTSRTGGLRLQHIKSNTFIGPDGLMVDEAGAADLDLVERSDCAEFPELTLDAGGEVTVTEFEDGSLFGFVETHAHLFTNLAFGGGGTFHGAPFHPLGVEHALPDCDLVHGEGGRRDLMGAGFSGGGDLNAVLAALTVGELPEDDHDTEGYPDFSDWPAAPFSSTHQVQYYKWIERAYLSGLRLLIQHATTNEFLCQLVVGVGAQPRRFDCNDMVNVDRIIEATYAMERYIDALAGGPGKGWFRIVFSPEEAREEIQAGNLAVVLGIEASDLFDCYLVPFGEFSHCTEEDVVAKLDEYHDKGVRVLFPVHKYDNGFSAGDGHRGIIDIGNFGHTGHYNNYVECPEELLEFPGGFDRGGVPFAGLNQPREVYDSPPPFDLSGFPDDPSGTLGQYAFLVLSGGSLDGEYCQNHGLTDLGEFLIKEMMKRGMILEVDHMPRKSYARAFEMLQEYDYPAIGTHGRNKNGEIYELGGRSRFNFGRCQSSTTPATMDDGLQDRVALMLEMDAVPAEGFGFDLNGFAGAPGPRFGERANCSDPQTDPITYPFKSYAGDITLEQPVVGNRTLDFNTEGMVHLGLVAELIEDVRRDGVTDEELEPLFRSAEGYIRMWEKAEQRAQALRN